MAQAPNKPAAPGADRLMNSRATQQRRVRAVIGISVGLTLLVTAALGGLGWKVLSQERALDRQRHRERLEQTAAAVGAGLLRRLAELEAALAQGGSRGAAALERLPGAHSVYVRFDRDAVLTHPRDALLYHPVVPTPRALNPAAFGEADRLEFQDKNDRALEGLLRQLAGSRDEHMRAEALLRLARVQIRRGAVAAALAVYGELRDVSAISPTLEVPYALLARVETCRLLQAANRPEAVAEEVRELRTALRSGRWPVRKASFVYYDTLIRGLSGSEAVDDEPFPRLAMTEAVHALWDEWQAFGAGEGPPLGQRVYRHDGTTILAVVSETSERVVAVMLTAEGLRHIVLDGMSTQPDTAGVAIELLDERSQPVLGTAVDAAGTASGRSLPVAGLPWQIVVSGPAARDSSASWRYLIPSLALVVLIVGAACYAIARGVSREWQTARLQSDFVSAVSHEFRSPLTTLAQLTELLAERRIQDESRRQTYFEVLQKETARLQQLVESLLDFGRMEANRKQYALQVLDFSDLVRAGVRDFQAEVERNGYDIRLETMPGAVPVRGDREALGRVLRNLLENAVKYSPDCRTVWVEARRETDVAVLSVRDHGMGIAADEQARIFDTFVRGEAAKRACIQGTGIGLSIVREVVRAHAGDIALVSDSGVGSTFTVRLPLAPLPGSAA